MISASTWALPLPVERCSNCKRSVAQVQAGAWSRPNRLVVPMPPAASAQLGPPPHADLFSVCCHPAPAVNGESLSVKYRRVIYKVRPSAVCLWFAAVCPAGHATRLAVV